MKPAAIIGRNIQVFTRKFWRGVFCFLFYLFGMEIQVLCCFADGIKESEDIKWFFSHERRSAQDMVISTNICFTNIDGSTARVGMSVAGDFHTTSHVLKLWRPDYEIGVELLDVSERYATIRIIETGEITSTWTNTIFNSQKYDSRIYLSGVSPTNLEATILYRRCNCYTNLIDIIKKKKEGKASGHSSNSGGLGSAHELRLSGSRRIRVSPRIKVLLKKSGSTRGTRRGDARGESPELDRQRCYVKTTA